MIDNNCTLLWYFKDNFLETELMPRISIGSDMTCQILI